MDDRPDAEIGCDGENTIQIAAGQRLVGRRGGQPGGGQSVLQLFGVVEQPERLHPGEPDLSQPSKRSEEIRAQQRTHGIELDGQVW